MTEEEGRAILKEAARLHRNSLDHALQRQAEVDANPSPQHWEIVHARESVASEQTALAVIGVQLAMLEAV